MLDLTSMFTVIVSNIFLPRLGLKVWADAALAIMVFPSRCHMLFEKANPGESPSTCHTQIPDHISTMNSPISINEEKNVCIYNSKAFIYFLPDKISTVQNIEVSK